MRPGGLFGQLWLQVVPHERAVTLLPWRGREAKEFPAILALLEAAATVDVPLDIVAYLEGSQVSFPCEVKKTLERAFVVMCALDQAAMRIHPSVKSRISGRSAPTGGMLSAMRTDRTITGFYAEIEGCGFVIPKGRLMPGLDRVKGDEQSGASLAHQFSFLSFLPLQPNLTLRPKAFPPNRLTVTDGAAQRVGLAPIAEDHDDLAFSASERNKRAFLDTVPGSVKLEERIRETVLSMLGDGAGLIVLPELVTSHQAIDDLSEILRRSPISQSAAILVGSGPSSEKDQGLDRPYNEAVILSGTGEELFRQRKLNPFNMNWQRMKDCQLERAAGHEEHFHMEDCAVGNELVVCDIHGLGRIVVLICEDLEQQVPGGNVCLHVLPDWILTPVLDVQLDFGRWEHRRAMEVSRKTLSRVVISCSASLQVRALGKEKLAEAGKICTGLCLDGLNNLRVKQISVGGKSSGQRAVVEWNSETWKEHRIVPKRKLKKRSDA